MTQHGFPIDERDRREIAPILAALLRARRCAAQTLRIAGARRASDIDLALTVGVAVPAAEMAALRETLEESRISFRIDLVDYATASRELRAAIDREGIEWRA